MNRRTFFGWIAKAALAAHMELGSLVPILVEPKFVEKWWYQVEINDHAAIGRVIYSYRVWLEEKDLAKYGLKHEDFADASQADAIPLLNDPKRIAVAEHEPMGERFSQPFKF